MKSVPEKSSFPTSLARACKGISYALKTEKHMRFHFFAAVLVVAFGLFFKLAAVEWLFIIYAIGSVIGAELMNTALERTVDLAKPEYHPLAGKAKEVAAGAVLVAAFQSIIIGVIIFGRHFWLYF